MMVLQTGLADAGRKERRKRSEGWVSRFVGFEMVFYLFIYLFVCKG